MPEFIGYIKADALEQRLRNGQKTEFKDIFDAMSLGGDFILFTYSAATDSRDPDHKKYLLYEEKAKNGEYVRREFK